MEVIHPHCTGLDIQNNIVCACCIISREAKGETIQTRSFNNTLTELLALSDWLGSNNITHVALDVTKEGWKTLYHVLEANFNVLVANTQRLDDVPGRNTHTPDAEWIAELLRYGLVRNSFIHPVPHKEVREVIRHRHYLMQQRVSIVNRLYRVLESANVKLVSLLSDVMQISARAILVDIAQGNSEISNPTNLVQISRRQQQPEQTYFKQVRPHHRFLIANYLNHVDFLDQQISVFNTQIAEYIQTKINQSTPESDSIQPKTPVNTSTSTDTHTTKLIPNWEEALAAFLNGGRI